MSAPKIIDCRLVAMLTGIASPTSRGTLSRKIGSSTMKAAPRNEPNMLPKPPVIEQGELLIPTAPGWGAEIDEKAVRAHPPRG